MDNNPSQNEDQGTDPNIPVNVEGCTYHFNPNHCGAGNLGNEDYVISEGETCDDPKETGCVSPICLETEDHVEMMPCLEFQKEGCNWYNTAGIPSTPPGVPCAPHKVGKGQFGGGVARWTLSMPDELADMLKFCKPMYHKYIQTDWDSILNLSTHPEWQSNLVVRRERGEQNMGVSEFINLAAKMAQMQDMIMAFNELTNLTNMNIGIGLVPLTPADSNDPPTYGLTATVDGTATGNPLPLVSQVDTNGNVIGLLLPVPA